MFFKAKGRRGQIEQRRRSDANCAIRVLRAQLLSQLSFIAAPVSTDAARLLVQAEDSAPLGASADDFARLIKANARGADPIPDRWAISLAPILLLLGWRGKAQLIHALLPDCVVINSIQLAREKVDDESRATLPRVRSKRKQVDFSRRGSPGLKWGIGMAVVVACQRNRRSAWCELISSRVTLQFEVDTRIERFQPWIHCRAVGDAAVRRSWKNSLEASFGAVAGCPNCERESPRRLK
jgi:hypothetical protein